VVVGTSLVVYPAAGLVNYVQSHVPVYLVDKKIPVFRSSPRLTTIEQPATTGVQKLKELLLG